jgi:hypothetical protein
MNPKLRAYLKRMIERNCPNVGQTDAEKMADNLVRNWKSTLEDMVHVLGTPEINVQDLFMDCVRYLTYRERGLNPL